MWMGGQQKRPADPGEGQTGTVTMSDGELAVLLESERRGVEVYAPAGYRWSPEPEQRVLVIQGRGEIPAVVGVRQGSATPKEAAVEAGQLKLKGSGRLSLSGGAVSVSGSSMNATLSGDAKLNSQNLDLQAQVYIRGELLEDFILRVVRAAMGWGGM